MKKTGSVMAVVLAAAVAQGQQAPAAAPKTWADSVTVKGDLRYRVENIDEDGKPSRQRDRIRARLGVDGKVNDNVKAGVELSTGDSDPISGNKSLGDSFAKKDMGLSLAYVDWTVAEGVTLTGGKMKNPFVCVSDLLWDGDLNPEGAAVSAARTVGNLDLSAAGAYWWLQERKDADDTKLYGAQASAKLQLTDEMHVTAGIGYYTYDNLEGTTPLDWEGKQNAYGNSTRDVVSGSSTNKVYAGEYSLIEGFGKLYVWVGTALEIYGHYVVNQDADREDTGYLAGFTVGKAKNPGTFEAGYNYRKLEKDAVLGAFADSDSWGGGTDGQGHKLSAKYQIAKNWQFGVAYFMNEKPVSDSAKKHDYNRLQVDLAAKF